jgi:outer membrane protein OmpA-like peptidoglycan-associated protein
MSKISRATAVLSALALFPALIAGGCASNKRVDTLEKDVDSKVGAVHRRVDDVEGQVEENQTRLDQQGRRIDDTSRTAQEALDRAIAAGKLAEGKLLFEAVLSDDKVRFGFDQAELSDPAKEALDEFAERLKNENSNVYIEIQGHTDSTGGEEYNLELGEKRAESVRRYLNLAHGLPLHRMSVISYGESAPVGENTSRDGRAQNRRVVLVVLQ